MANALYDAAREKFLTAQLDWTVVAIKALLVDTGAYTVNLATDLSLANIAAGARIATSGNLTTKTATGGAADADNVTFLAVPVGTGGAAAVEAIVLCTNTGTDATSYLIAYIDTATGLPITPNGGDIIVTWDNGPNKIFKL